jgi:hypothetical protein
MKKREENRKTVILLLLFLMLSFHSCDTADYCWVCENAFNPLEWQTVCSPMTKNKLESYGWICTPY